MTTIMIILLVLCCGVAPLALTICNMLMIPKCKKCGKKTTPVGLEAALYPCFDCMVAYDIVDVDGVKCWRESKIKR